MRAVVLQCHPLRDSYNEALLDRTVAGLTDGGAAPEVFRLAEGADPPVDEVAGADILAMVYPTWWGGLPAPLLGWVQGRLGPWIDEDASSETSPLRSVQALVSVTTHGSSRIINRLQGEAGRKLLTRTVAPLCATEAEHHWIALYKLDRLSPAELEAFLVRAETEVRATCARLAA